MDEVKSEQGWVDTNALRRVGVELDGEWGREQADNIMYTLHRRRRRGTREFRKAAD